MNIATYIISLFAMLFLIATAHHQRTELQQVQKMQQIILKQIRARACPDLSLTIQKLEDGDFEVINDEGK